MRTTTSSPSSSSSRDLRPAAHRRLDPPCRAAPGPRAASPPPRRRARRSTPSGSRSGTMAHVEHDRVGDHHVVLALREGRVEEAQRAHDPFYLTGEAAGLQPDALTDPEGPRAASTAREQVAERLLRRKPDDHGSEGAAGRQRLGPTPATRRATRWPARRRPDGSGTPPCPRSPGPGGGRAWGRRARPTSRAIRRGRGSGSRPTVAIRTGVSYSGPNSVARGSRRRPGSRRASGTMTIAWIRARLTARDAQLPGEAGLAPGVALGVEELLHGREARS